MSYRPNTQRLREGERGQNCSFSGHRPHTTIVSLDTVLRLGAEASVYPSPIPLVPVLYPMSCLLRLRYHGRPWQEMGGGKTWGLGYILFLKACSAGLPQASSPLWGSFIFLSSSHSVSPLRHPQAQGWWQLQDPVLSLASVSYPCHPFA